MLDRSTLTFPIQIIITIIVWTLFQSVNATQDNIFESSNKIDQNSVDYFNNVTNLSNNIGHSELPQLAVYGNNVYVVWIDDTSGKRDVYFKRSIDNGCTFNHTIDLSNQSGGSVDQQIAASENNVFVVWEHTPGNNGAIYFTRSTDNGVTFDRIRNLGNNTGFNGFPQIAVSGNNVYVVWTNNFQGKYGQVFFSRSTDNGVTFSTPTPLHRVKDDGIGDTVFSPQITADSGSNKCMWYGIVGEL